MKKLKNYLILIAMMLSTSLYSQLPQAVVYAVHDGDSYKVGFIGDTTNTKIWIRLHLVDAPEVRSNTINKDQTNGRMIADYMRNYLKGDTVSVDTLYRDIYNRPVTKVYKDKVDVSEYMLQNGYAWYISDGSKNIDPKYKKAYLQARKLKIGIWDDKNIIKPSTFRKKNRY